VKHLRAELNSKGGLMLILETPLHKAEKETAFADICVGKEVLESPTMMNLKRYW
jgi:hypothetical protein